MFKNLAADPQAASESLTDLTSLFPMMPDLKLSDRQRPALVAWVNSKRGSQPSASGPGNAAQGGNR
jgi:hypothetical protein